MKAFRIPADSSQPVEEIEFDRDKLWLYEIARYDRDKIFLTEKSADLDHVLRNQRASECVRHHSDAAKDSDNRLGSPTNLYGDVVVLGYDKFLEMRTGLTKVQRPEAGPCSSEETDRK
jgi:hypothetical protein